MKLLGLRLCEHDSNISYFDGEQLHYYKSERTYQEKHHALNSLTSWQQEIKSIWGVDYLDIDEIAIIVDPWRYSLPSVTFFPETDFNYLSTPTKTIRLNHHYAHALSSWMIEPNANIHIVIDGFGDEDIAWTVFKNNQIIDQGNTKINGSIGFNMSTVGYNFGMTNCHGLDIAGKLMGLQSYGNICYEFIDTIKHYGVKQADDMFNFNNWVAYKNDSLLAELTKLDWIKSVHYHIGEKLIEFFSEYADEDSIISYSGGVAQNVIWNTRLKSKFKNIIIPPHCADDGLSLGAVEWLRIKHNLPAFKMDKFPFIQSDESPNVEVSQKTINTVAQALSEGKIIAWYQDNGEIGPRALGNRSILMDARIINGKDKINTVKNREFYRPFGASVLKSHKFNYFRDLPDNPYMLYVGELNNNNFPAITHIDGTCRAQTVDDDTIFGRLLTQFYNITGSAILLNTSLNLAGKPIAAYIENAEMLFNESIIDVLVVGNTVIHKIN